MTGYSVFHSARDGEFMHSRFRLWETCAIVDKEDGSMAWTDEEKTVPIRLSQTPTTCGVEPCSRIKLGIGWRLGAARDAEQRAEGVERIKAPVEPEREFIEVGL